MNPALHGLRGFAAMLVLLFHWSTAFPEVNNWLAGITFGPKAWMNLSLPLAVGWQGVPLFFVLSAYLLTSQWRERALDLTTIARFWKRRLFRIYPAVWLQVLLLVFFSLWIFPIVPSLKMADWVCNIFLWINLPPMFIQPINGVWWTLPIELMFYLVLPLLIYLQRRSHWLVVSLLCLMITMLWRSHVVSQLSGTDIAQKQYILDALPGSIFTFASGFALAFIPSVLSRQKFLLLLPVFFAAYCFLEYLQWENASTYWRGGWLLIVRGPLLSVIVALGVYLVLNASFKVGLFSNRVLVWCGNLSFGIYLWHFPVLQFMQSHFAADLTGRRGSLLALCVCLLLTFSLAAISYYLVERPLMGWGKPVRQ